MRSRGVRSLRLLLVVCILPLTGAMANPLAEAPVLQAKLSNTEILDMEDDHLLVGVVNEVEGVGLMTGGASGWQTVASFPCTTGDLDLAHSRIAIGCPSDDQVGPDAGRVKIYAHDAEGWTNEGIIVPPSDQAPHRFGYSLSLQGDNLLVAAWNGVVYAYRFGDVGWESVDFPGVPKPAGLELEWAGTSMDLDGDTAFVNALFVDSERYYVGEVYEYTWSQSGWTITSRLTSPDGVRGRFGEMLLDIEGDRLLIGDFIDDSGAPLAGSAYLYSRTNGVWSLDQRVTPPDSQERQAFGFAGALVDDTALIGAPFDNELASWAGAAYIYQADGTTWSLVRKLHSPDPSRKEFFGGYVGASTSGFALGLTTSYVYGNQGPPSEVRGLSTSPGTKPGAIDLRWEPPASDGGAAVAGYRIYRQTSDGEMLVGSTTGLSFTVEENAAPVRHHFAVRPFNAFGESLLPAPTASGAGTGLPSTSARAYLLEQNELIWFDADGDGRHDPGEEQLVLLGYQDAMDIVGGVEDAARRRVLDVAPIW